MTAAPQRPTSDAVVAAAALLRAGELVAFPTETVYGLGGDASNGRAVAAIFETKERPRFNPLIVHVADLTTARELVRLSGVLVELARAFWPGPLTLAGPRTPDCPVSDLASAGLPTLAVRVPAHDVALALLHAVDRPLAAPSANPSGRVSPTTAAHVAAGLGDHVAMILDGGPCPIGLESTVVAAVDGRAAILRPGAIPAEDIARVAGPLAPPQRAGMPNAPGQLSRHYAPHARLRLNARDTRPGEALVSFGPPPPGHDGPELALSPAGNLREAAANLFAVLHRLDAEGYAGAAVSPIPEEGLGRAINDRLRRAARR